MKITLLLASLLTLSLTSLRADEVEDSIQEALANYKKGSLSEAGSSLQYAAKLIEEKKGAALGQLLPAPLAGWEAGEVESNSLAESDRFEGPTDFILGGRSRYVLESDHAVVKSHFPQARIEVIAESGHNPHMDAREAFVRAVLAAL